MPAFKITLAYDGTDFVGWQRQASGTSVQGVLEAALRDLDQREIAVQAAGRTDAGVHARGQVASFLVARMIDAPALLGALNSRLPDTVRVLAAEQVPETFHARFAATRKTYQYRIWNAAVCDPFERRYAWHLTGTLDTGAMAEAAAVIEGTHDFAAFRAAGGEPLSTVREVFSSRVTAGPAQRPRSEGVLAPGLESVPPNRAALITYEITGDGFLRHMVRTIVGSLVEIGRGRRSVPWMADALHSRRREFAGPTAPPHGLVLIAVEYQPALLAGSR
jgi:tRNA pseudouridine38-40 synthase